MRADPRWLAELLRRCGAACGAALVLALAVFAASPVAHDWLHHDHEEEAAQEDACAVVIFANGLSLPLDPPSLAPPVALSIAPAPSTPRVLRLVAPRYLLQPERGPPTV